MDDAVMTRLNAIPAELLAHTLLSFPAVLQALCTWQTQPIAEAFANASQHTPNGRYLVACELAVAVCAQTRLDAAPIADIDAILAEYPTITLTTPDGYDLRTRAARQFLRDWMLEDFAAQLAVADEHGDALLYGLAELCEASCPRTHA